VSISRENKVALAIVGGLIAAGRLNMLKHFDRPVRCSDGHLFTTIWIPLASLKAVRLGDRRFQHCPVGHHWTTVTPVDETSAMPADLQAAAALHDMHIP
jgi:hypothetical protein